MQINIHICINIFSPFPTNQRNAKSTFVRKHTPPNVAILVYSNPVLVIFFGQKWDFKVIYFPPRYKIHVQFPSSNGLGCLEDWEEKDQSVSYLRKACHC